MNNAFKARGVKTYEPTGRDIMADSLGETSLVGFGTQLARELLSPGILKRERQVSSLSLDVMCLTFRREKGQWPQKLKKQRE